MFLACRGLRPGEHRIFGTVDLPVNPPLDERQVHVGLPDPDDAKGAKVPVGPFLDDADGLAEGEGGQRLFGDGAERLGPFRGVDAFEADLVPVRAESPDTGSIVTGPTFGDADSLLIDGTRLSRDSFARRPSPTWRGIWTADPARV